MFYKKADEFAELKRSAILATEQLAALPADSPNRPDVLSSAQRAQRKLFQAMLDSEIDGFVDRWIELSALLKLSSDWGTLPRKTIFHNLIDYITQRRTLRLKNVDDTASAIRGKALGQ